MLKVLTRFMYRLYVRWGTSSDQRYLSVVIKDHAERNVFFFVCLLSIEAFDFFLH